MVLVLECQVNDKTSFAYWKKENELIASWTMRIQNQVALCKHQNFADKHMGDHLSSV